MKQELIQIKNLVESLLSKLDNQSEETEQPQSVSPRLITNKFPAAKCKRCGKSIRENDECYWIAKKGVYHLDCLDLNEDI